MLSEWTFLGEWKNRLSKYLSLLERQNYILFYRLPSSCYSEGELIAGFSRAAEVPTFGWRSKFANIYAGTRTLWLADADLYSCTQNHDSWVVHDWMVGSANFYKSYTVIWLIGWQVRSTMNEWLRGTNFYNSTRHFDWMVWGYNFYAAPEQISHVGYKV